MHCNKSSTTWKGRELCMPLILATLLAGCASPLPNAVTDKRPSGNAGVTLRDISTETWVFEVGSDPMTGASGYSSSIWSRTSVQLAYPYNGDQKLTLRVGKAPKGVSYAAVAIQRGQFSCYGCDVRVKFDDNSPTIFTGESSVEVSGVMYLKGASRFIENLRNSKKVTIEVPFFDNPRKAVEFKGDGFPW